MRFDLLELGETGVHNSFVLGLLGNSRQEVGTVLGGIARLAVMRRQNRAIKALGGLDLAHSTSIAFARSKIIVEEPGQGAITALSDREMQIYEMTASGASQGQPPVSL